MLNDHEIDAGSQILIILFLFCTDCQGEFQGVCNTREGAAACGVSKSI